MTGRETAGLFDWTSNPAWASASRVCSCSSELAVGTWSRLPVGRFSRPTKTAITANTRWKDLEFYVNDTWKIRPNVTLDLGVRYSIFFNPYDAYDNLTWASFDGFRASVAKPGLIEAMREDDRGFIDASTYVGTHMSLVDQLDRPR